MAGSAAAQPYMPAPLRGILERFGVAPEDVENFVQGQVSGAAAVPPVTSPVTAARMERARHEDIVARPGDALFDDINVRLGVWNSGVFLRTYGTALLLAAPWDDARTPVFLIHGMNGSPRDLVGLVSHLRATSYQPVVFFYPTGMSLAQASQELGLRLQEFAARHSIKRFAIIGHSMGGLVAKGLLDEYDVRRALPSWKVLVGISSPWRGVAWAAYGHHLPRHPASWDDLAPASSFMRRVNRTPFPPQLGFYIFFGARSRHGILSGLGSNDGQLTVDSVMDTPLTQQARDTFGFYENHASIIEAPQVFERLEMVLDRELTRVPKVAPQSPSVPD
jgi:pimeloyl-ACP methyl ester carboxylesterase